MRAYFVSSVRVRRALLGLSLAAGSACSDASDLNPQPDPPRPGFPSGFIDPRNQPAQGGNSSLTQAWTAKESSAGDSSESDDANE